MCCLALLVLIWAVALASSANTEACNGIVSSFLCEQSPGCAWRSSLCLSTRRLHRALAAATKPSKLPTRVPSKKPTKVPTVKPSKRPTAQPTTKPSKPPSVKPTKRPTSQPTSKPSKSPSPAPTKKPSKAPSPKPTKATTAKPTKKPTVANPTLSPTKAPAFSFSVTQLIGPGMVSTQAAQGYSVAMTANYVLVGGFYDNSKTGAAWLFTRAGQFLQKLITTNFGATPKNEYMFGLSVAMTDEVIVIGAPRDSNRLGAVFVFTKQQDDQFMETQKLMFINPWELTGAGDGTHLSNEVGFSVAITPQGNRIVAGAPAHNYGRGAVVVYALDNGKYEFEALLTTAEQVGISVLGTSVAVNAAGNLILAGAPDATTKTQVDYTNGGSWTFARNAKVWEQRGSMLRGKMGTNPDSLCKQGFSVSLNAAGTRALIGGPFNNNLEGGAWVFDYNSKSGAWVETAFLYSQQSAHTLPEIGHAVALSDDGTVAVLGGPKDSNNAGAVFVFALQAKTSMWLEAQKLTPTHTVDNARMGVAVAIHGRNTVLAGGPYHHALQGAVWLFEGF